VIYVTVCGGNIDATILVQSFIHSFNYHSFIHTFIPLLLYVLSHRVVIPLCGGNIDTTILGRCLERGLAADNRLCRFVVTVSDRPGGIAELTRLIASIGVRCAHQLLQYLSTSCTALKTLLLSY